MRSSAIAGTATIVLISKPPAPRVAEQVLQRLARCRKQSVVCFLGLDKPGLAPHLARGGGDGRRRKLELERSNPDKKVKAASTACTAAARCAAKPSSSSSAAA